MLAICWAATNTLNTTRDGTPIRYLEVSVKLLRWALFHPESLGIIFHEDYFWTFLRFISSMLRLIFFIYLLINFANPKSPRIGRLHGIFGMWRGVLPPIATVPLIKAGSFSTYEASNRWFQKYFCQDTRGFVGKKSHLVNFTSGLAGGLSLSWLQCIQEHIKIRMQLDKDKRFRHSFHAGRVLVRENGARWLFRGTFAWAV